MNEARAVELINEELGQVPAVFKAQARLVQNIIAACKEMQRVDKQGRNDFHKYDYIRLEDVITEVRSALLRHGVYFYRSNCIIRSYDIRQSETKTGTYVTLDLQYTMTDGYASIVMPAVGEARATDDKAVQKAESSGLKYCLFQNFLLQHEADADIDKGNGDGLDAGHAVDTNTGEVKSPANSAPSVQEPTPAPQSPPESTPEAKNGHSQRGPGRPRKVVDINTPTTVTLESLVEIQTKYDKYMAAKDAETRERVTKIIAAQYRLPLLQDGKPDFSKFSNAKHPGECLQILNAKMAAEGIE